MHSTLQKQNSLAGLFAGLAAASIWGGMYVVSKVVLEVIPPFALLTIRLVMGALTLGIVIYFQKDQSCDHKRNALEKSVGWFCGIWHLAWVSIRWDKTFHGIQWFTGHIGYASFRFAFCPVHIG